MADLRGQLVEWTKKTPGFTGHSALFYAQGAPHPPYNTESVSRTLARFEAEILPQSPITDPLGRSLILKRESFPKLINIKRIGKDRGRAKEILASIGRGELEAEDGKFANKRFTWQRDRIETLFWLPDVLCDPDAIFRSCHQKIVADEVYVKVYNKMGSQVKLAFIGGVRERHTYIVTSFLTNGRDASDYIKGEPLYLRPSPSAEIAIAAHAAIATP